MVYARIAGTGSYLPEKVLSNVDLEKLVDTSHQWILERTGISRRHILADHETTSSMAAEASLRAIEAAGIDKTKIGMIIVATCTPDRSFPSTACILQRRLEIVGCPAFDVGAACSGYLYALSIAGQYIQTGQIESALVVGSEAMSRLIDWTDRSTCVLFSDGAGATLLQANDKPGVLSTHIHADGRYTDLLYAPNHLGEIDEPPYIQMRGSQVFKIAVGALGKMVDEALAHNDLKKSEIDWLIPHQANLRIIQATAKRLNLPMERVVLTVENHGNTSAASIPLALDTAVRDGRIKRGDLMLMDAFGAGFVSAAAVIRY